MPIVMPIVMPNAPTMHLDGLPRAPLPDIPSLVRGATAEFFAMMLFVCVDVPATQLLQMSWARHGIPLTRSTLQVFRLRFGASLPSNRAAEQRGVLQGTA